MKFKMSIESIEMSVEVEKPQPVKLSSVQIRALALSSQRESMHWTPYRYQCNFDIKSNTWISLHKKGLITFNPYERRAGFWDITITEAGRLALQSASKSLA